MVNQALFVHSNTIVLDYKLVFWWKDLHVYIQIDVRLVFESLFFQSIRGVWQELSYENLTVSIERLGDDV